MRRPGTMLFLIGGSFSVFYGVVVIFFVATSPDLRVRCLLNDETVDGQLQEPGPIIRETPGLECQGPRPKKGDVLLQIGDRQTRTFLDFTDQLIALRNMPIPPGGSLPPNTDLRELDSVHLPSLVEIGDGERFVRIKSRNRETGSVETTWLLVQSIPFGEVVLTFVWFLLQVGVFVIGALAYWHRPFDRAARLFYAMCVVTLGAFVGGYHWWVIAGSLVLNVPFALCAILVPAVTLHFFLSFPRSKPPLSRWPRRTAQALYVVPVVAVVGMLVVQAYTHWLNSWTARAGLHADEVLQAMAMFRQGIYGYLTISGAYFLLTLVALIYSFFTTRSSVEHNQVKWILWAGLIATVPLGYSLGLAHIDRVGFAFGRARVPMFLASLCFMLAYAVGVVRYKLMLIDQIVSKGMLYYAVSFGLTIVFATLIASTGVVQQLLNISPSPFQLSAVFAILLLSVTLLLWLRDRLQQMIDRRFFREKYQLDKALARMNRAVGHLVDQTALAELMLGSCRDVLRVERAAMYLRSSTNGPFELVATQGADGVPSECMVDRDSRTALHQNGVMQRVTPGSRGITTPVQLLLRELRADLIHGLEVDGGIAGFVILGAKKNGSPYTAEDVTFLNALGQLTSVALHSAKVQQDIRRLNEELRLKVDRIGDQRRRIAMLQAELTSTQEAHPGPPEEKPLKRDAVKGKSPAIRRVLDTVRKVAKSDSSVLIRGESGTGKELLAQVLHDNGPRREGPTIRVHCAALSPSLLESELFGHVKGAFTGAHRDKIGRFEAANGGTLFLDEIGDISLEIQVKLLRVLQERCFEPVGGSRTVHVDVRLITATHQDLEALIADGRFREDLYYRLNVISITLPPLRERREDLIELALHFLNLAAKRMGKRITHIDEDALAALEQYHWPGNIRELENAIERAVVLTEEDRISIRDLPAEIVTGGRRLPHHVVETKTANSDRIALSQPPAFPAAQQPDSNRTSGFRPDGNEREVLEDALQQCGGNKAHAARMLGLPRSTFFSKLKKHSLA